MNKIKAVIFDMDGLMFDTENLAIRLWLAAGKRFGYDITKEMMIECIGRTWQDSREILKKHLGQDFPYDQVRTDKSLTTVEYVNENGVPVKRGLYELLDWLKIKGYKLAVGTSTRRDSAEFKLKKAGVFQYFDEYVYGDDVEKGKPEPDIFLMAAGKLGMIPEECLVFEDSFNGIRAAHRAGMRPVMVPDVLQPDEEINKLIYARLNNLAEAIDNNNIYMEA